MATRLLDTNIVSFLTNNHTLAAVYGRHLAGHELAISFQTLAELLHGGVRANWGPARWAALDAVLANVVFLQSDDAVCGCWAEVMLVRRSQPASVQDAWIAATALAHNLELVTHNPADFAGIPGLVVVSEAP